MAAARALGLIAVAAAAAGCGQDAPSVPVACKEGPGAIRTALERAPAAVRLEGETPISDCFARGSEAGDVAILGSSLLVVTQDLAAAARRRPDGPAARRLGYLMGAVRRGADRTVGIHEELVRRLEQELVPVDTRAAGFRAGEAAGRRTG